MNWREKVLKGKNPFYLIWGLGLIVYGWSVTFGFTYLDDNVLILDNLFYIKNLGNIFNSFRLEVFHVLHASAAYYRPILTISFILDAQISGASPVFYHITNILIHLTTVSLIYVFLNELGYEKEKSLVVSLLFLVHPVLTQAVVWIPGRNDSLLLLFVLPAFIYFLKFLDGQKEKYLYYHFLFFALAIFTKESAIFMTLLILFYLQFVRGDELFSNTKIKLGLGWGLVGMFWFVLRSSALANPVGYTLTSAVETVGKNILAVVLYLGKAFFPVNLSVLPTLVDSTLVWGWISMVILVAMYTMTKKKRNKMIIFGSVWFLVFLLPSFIRPSSYYAPDFIEHRMYVPMVGLGIVLLELVGLRDFSLKKQRDVWVVGGLIFVFSVGTLWFSRPFRDQISFWTNAVDHSPSHPLAHKNLGAMYYLDGRLEEAEISYKKSLEINPVETMVHNNLGLIYFDWGDYARAEEEYKSELEINPYYDRAYFNYGLLKYVEGYKEEAVEMWVKTLEINPDHYGAYRNLVAYYSEIKDMEKAQYFYNEALRRGFQL